MKCSEMVVVAALAALLLCSAAQAAGSSSRRLAAAPPAPGQNATGDCCARLAAIGFKSELPVVVVDSAGQAIPHHVDTPVQLCTCNSGQPFKDYAGPAIAAGRGTSSANFTKKCAPGGGFCLAGTTQHPPDQRHRLLTHSALQVVCGGAAECNGRQ